jgi:bacterioferritin (cytochrome b1)
MDAVWPYLAAILPTILVAILFYFLIKSMLEGDRRERVAQRRFEAEQDRERARAGSSTTDPARGEGPPTPDRNDPDSPPDR